MRSSPFRSTLLTVVTAAAVVAGFLVGITGQATAAPARVVAAVPAGAGPVAQRLPVNATPRHGRSTLTHVAPYAPKAPTTKWTPSARPAGKVASALSTNVGGVGHADFGSLILMG